MRKDSLKAFPGTPGGQILHLLKVEGSVSGGCGVRCLLGLIR